MRPRPFQLVVLIGRPGVGKLTIGRHLAEFTGYRLFHNHLAVDLALSQSQCSDTRSESTSP